MLRKSLLVIGALVALVVVAAIIAVLVIDPDEYRAEIAERASEQIGREVTLAGPMSLRLFPWLAIELSEVGVANPADFGEAPPLARVGTVTASIRVWPLVRGNLETGALRLEDARLHMVTNEAGRSNLDGLFEAETDPDRPEADVDLSRLSLGGMRLRNVALITLDQRTGDQSQLLIEDLTVDPFRVEQPVPFRLIARLDDAQGERLRLDSLQGQIQVARDASVIDLTRLVADFELPDGAGSGSVRAAVNMDLQPADPVLTLPVLEAHLMVDALRLGLVTDVPITMSLGETVSAVLESARISLNEQELAASGEVHLTEILRVRLELSGQTLDLRPLMNGADRAPADHDEPAAPGEFAGFEGMDVAFSLTLEELIVSDALSLDQIRAEAQLQDNVLVLSPLDARLLGGRFDGRLEVDFNQDPPRVALQPRLSGILVDQLAALGGTAAPVRGSGDFELDLSFAGFGLSDILASLDGRGSYSIEQGALLGVDLQRLVNEELTTSNLTGVSRAFGGQTEFQSFGGTLEARAGIVELPDLQLTAADFGLSGVGRIDLPAGLVDYRVELNLGEALTSRLPRAVRDATGGRVPLAIAGPISEPTVQMDLGGMAERALFDQIEQRLRREPQDEAEPADSEQASADVAEAEREPEQRERTSDLLLRTVRDRRQRDRDDEPEEADEEPVEEDPDEEPPTAP